MKKVFLIIVVIISFSGCKKDVIEIDPKPILSSINGAAQKGPFLNGTSITVYELDQNYSQTGKSFSTQINNNIGSFQLNNIQLLSNFIQIKAEGFYFNEVCGSNSITPITLNCISDISGAGSININLLTHLEKPRVEYLLSMGISLSNAKIQAQNEILNIFNISSNGIQNSEYLDISQSGEGNAKLLAISSILQGFRTESELSTLLAVISNDIQVDGILNDVNTKSSLIDHAILLDTLSIRNNVSNFYSNLGINVIIPPFEKYINQFIVNSTFPITNSVITYSPTGLYGENFLLKNQLTYTGSDFSMKGQLKRCSSLKLRFHILSGNIYAYQNGTNNNLNITTFNSVNNEQFFTVIDPNLPFDLHLVIFGTGSSVYSIEYFEINSITPSFSKIITVN